MMRRSRNLSAGCYARSITQPGYTFALRVQGDCMTPRHSKRSYPEGCIIFVAPELRSPNNSQRIVARLRDSSETTFKV